LDGKARSAITLGDALKKANRATEISIGIKSSRRPVGINAATP